MSPIIVGTSDSIFPENSKQAENIGKLNEENAVSMTTLKTAIPH